MTLLLALLYVAAAAAANLVIAAFGPVATPYVAFGLVGLDLTCRDLLHDRWEGHGLVWRMSWLVLAGSLAAWAVNPDAGRVALASALAFGCAGLMDMAVYALLRDRHRLVRINGSNVPAALADTLVFLGVAFGASGLAFAPLQLGAKVAGGFVWSLLLVRLVGRRRTVAA